MLKANSTIRTIHMESLLLSLLLLLLLLVLAPHFTLCFTFSAGNCIGPCGASQIADALEVNSSVTKVRLDGLLIALCRDHALPHTPTVNRQLHQIRCLRASQEDIRREEHRVRAPGSALLLGLGFGFGFGLGFGLIRRSAAKKPEAEQRGTHSADSSF